MKNALHKRCQGQKNLHVDLNLHVDPEKKIQFIRSRSDGITRFFLYKSIQRNVKKEENNILKTDHEKLRNHTKNTMLPLQPFDVVTNLSKYQLNVEEIY